MHNQVLDEVRDSFSADLTRFLGQVEHAAGSLLGALAHLGQPDLGLERHLDDLSVNLHAIGGTSSLVGVTTLMQNARDLEAMATAAGESVRQLGVHTARRRSLAATCQQSAQAMRSIMEAELAADPADADERSR